MTKAICIKCGIEFESLKDHSICNYCYNKDKFTKQNLSYLWHHHKTTSTNTKDSLTIASFNFRLSND